MLQIIVQGMLLSGLYALIAIGFTLIFSVGRVLNLGYGAYLMFGGYVFFYVSQTLGMPKLLAIACAAGIGAAMGALKYLLIARPLKGDQVATVISTLILAVVLQSAVILVFGDSTKIMHSLVPGVLHITGVNVLWNNILAAGLSWLLILGLYVFITRTHTGRAMQAVSMDARGAVISGIDLDRVNLVTWSISGFLGAIAGVFFASYTQLSPSMWVAPLIITVAIVIVGGIGSIWGTLVVAHIVGFLEVIVVSHLAPELRGVITMALIILVLVFRPIGLFGRKELS